MDPFFQDVFEMEFENMFENIEDVDFDINEFDDMFDILSCAVEGIPISLSYNQCVVGYPCEVIGVPLEALAVPVDALAVPVEALTVPVVNEVPLYTTNLQQSWVEFVPQPPLKSKNTDVETLGDMEDNITQALAEGDASRLAQQDYVLFGGRDAAAASTSREMDRNKDVALVLKMVSALYDIPLCRVYGDMAKITCAACVTCDTHKPQRGSLLCYYCAKKNTQTFAALVQQYVEKNKVV
jgi:hypothetical protein